jgi:hypothetical protein
MRPIRPQIEALPRFGEGDYCENFHWQSHHWVWLGGFKGEAQQRD